AYPDATIVRVSSQGYNFVAPKVGRPLLIRDLTPTNYGCGPDGYGEGIYGGGGYGGGSLTGTMSEVVIPTQVIVGPTGASINAPMYCQHLSYTVWSGTAGLQEAIDYQSSSAQGAIVVLTPAWTAAGGVTGMVTSAYGNASVSILDERTSCLVPYIWSGSAYVAGASFCSNGGGLNQLTQDVLAGPGTGSQAATVVGIRAQSIPTLAAGYLHWTGSVFSWDTPGGSFTYPTGTGIVQVTAGTSWGTTLGVGTGANNIPQLDGSGLLLAAVLPQGSSSAFGALKCGSGTSCSSGTISVPATGVTSIDSQTGAFTFGGSGVSHVGNAYTFSGSGSGIGSIAWTVPSFMTATPSTLSASGTQAFSFNTQAANLVFAGPSSGSAAAPGFRALVSADIPNNAASTSNSAGSLSGSLTPCSSGYAIGIVANGNASCVAFTPEIVASFAGVPPNGQVMAFYPITTGMTVPSSCTGSYAGAKIAATGTAAFTVIDHAGGPLGSSTTLCTATFSASGTVASFSGSAGGTITAGDYIEVDAPGTADATLSTIGIGIYATR
ncbi:MAG: hypothetical protein WB608_01360, partial [Terracidiphilus sp.]